MAENMYEYYTRKEAECIEKALKTEDLRLYVFYKNAASGFRGRRDKLKIADIAEEREV